MEKRSLADIAEAEMKLDSAISADGGFFQEKSETHTSSFRDWREEGDNGNLMIPLIASLR